MMQTEYYAHTLMPCSKTCMNEQCSSNIRIYFYLNNHVTINTQKNLRVARLAVLVILHDFILHSLHLLLLFLSSLVMMWLLIALLLLVFIKSTVAVLGIARSLAYTGEEDSTW